MAEPSEVAKTFRVDFEPVGRRVVIPASQTLLAAAQVAGVGLAAICGGAGSCGGCRLLLVSGELSPPTRTEREVLSPEELAVGYRLACQTVPLSDVKVHIPPESLTTAQRLQIEGREVEIELDPVVVALDVQLDPPSLHDLRADSSRLQSAVERHGRAVPSAGLPVLARLSDQLRAQNWSVRLALRHDEVVAVLPARSPVFGLSVDVGTTKLAVYLVGLESGETVAKVGAMNPQIAYGEDVVSRIAYANENREGRRLLQSRLVATLNEIVAGLCTEAATSPDHIVEAVVVGNTVMHHLFAGLPVWQLGMAPYVPAVGHALDIPAREIGLSLAPGAYVHLPPNIAGYVGADHVAMLLASDMQDVRRSTLALDIGTNTEITLAFGDRLLSCSCASGPAFEGAHIRDGMRATAGAIERVQIAGEEIRFHTIANAPPVGICGSGILDAVAEMLDAGILDRRGALQEGRPRVRTRDGQLEFVLVPAGAAAHGRDIVVTRKDVNEIQLAKAAIRVGIEILLAEANITAEDIEEVIVAGAFGTYLNVASAVRVGMLPDLPLGRFRQAGNAAGVGAKQMLLSVERRRRAQEIVQGIEYVELTNQSGFSAEFFQAMYL